MPVFPDAPKKQAAQGPDQKVMGPRETLRGGIPGAVLEPLVRSWSHFVGIHRQKLTQAL